MTAPIVSPTSITNSVPRPKSPRRVDPGFHKAYGEDGSDQPQVRRRTHEEMGRFGGRKGFTAQAFKACVSPQVLDNHADAVMCIDSSVEKGHVYAERYGPVAKRNLVKAAGVGKEYAVDFAMTTAEIYRQDCKSEQRGKDADFFVNPKRPPGYEDDNENSLLAGEGEMKSPDLNNNEEKETNSVAEQSSVHLNAPAPVPAPAFNRSTSEPRSTRAPAAAALTAPTPLTRTQRFPQTNDLLVNPVLSPPRAPVAPSGPTATRSLDRKTFETDVQPKENLRATRLELFRMAGTDSGEPESRISKAFQDLDRRDQIIDGLKRQLQMTQSELDGTVQRLDEVQAQAKDRQFKATEDRAKAIQERKKMEDRYYNEAEQTAVLQDMVSQLKVEVSSLKMALRGKHKGDPNYFPTNVSFEDPSVIAASSSNGQVISMRAEIVELRSQLAEAHAQLVDDTASVRTYGELEELRDKLRKTEEELKILREKEENYKQLKEQLFLMEYSAKETKNRLEDTLKKASDTEIDLRSELQKTKASLQRLQTERSRKQLQDNANTERANKQLEASRQEVERLKEELAFQKSATAEEIARLSTELDEVKQKLSVATKESVEKKSEVDEGRRQIEKDMAKQKEVIKTLQQQIYSKDEKVISQVRQIAELERLLNENGINSQSFLTKISDLESEIKVLESSKASLQQELQLQKDLLKEEREAAAQAHSGQTAVDKESVWRLRERLEKVKESANGTIDDPNFDVEARVREASLRQEVGDLKKEIVRLQSNQSSDSVKEDILLKEISHLKAKLDESAAKYEEESRRVQEERRMSRQSASGHDQEIERLRNERNESLYARHKLEDELAEMRKKLIAATQENMSIFSAHTQGSDASQVSENVARLRNELAIARERLATARDQSRSRDDVPTHQSNSQTRSFLMTQKEASQCESNKYFVASSSPGMSGGDSQGSSWAPPVIERLVSVSPAPDATPVVPNQIAAVISAGVSKPSLSTPRTITPEKTEIDTVSRSVMSSASRDSSDLQKRLEESKKRLDKANSRLETLLGPRNGPNQTPLKNIVVVEGGTASLQTPVSMIDEVLSSPSGNIEIRHRSAAII